MLRRNCFSKHVIEGKIGGRIEVRGRRRSRKLLDDLKEWSRYLKVKQEAALNRTLWRTCFGRGYGPVVRDYVITMMMIMMITRPYSSTAINKHCLARELTTVSQLRNMCYHNYQFAAWPC